MAEDRALIRAEEKETGRVEAFSDGVFAVAITLLAFNLQVPKLGDAATPGQLALALARQWPSYIGFVTSFFTVLIMWVNHHGVFRLIQKTNARLLFVNGYLLMMTTAVPFSTSLVTQYLESFVGTLGRGPYHRARSVRQSHSRHIERYRGRSGPLG